MPFQGRKIQFVSGGAYPWNPRIVIQQIIKLVASVVPVSLTSQRKPTERVLALSKYSKSLISQPLYLLIDLEMFLCC